MAAVLPRTRTVVGRAWVVLVAVATLPTAALADTTTTTTPPAVAPT
jgi:hypothetical protein